MRLIVVIPFWCGYMSMVQLAPCFDLLFWDDDDSLPKNPEVVAPVPQDNGLPFVVVPVNGTDGLPQFENLLETPDEVPLNARLRKVNESKGSKGRKGSKGNKVNDSNTANTANKANKGKKNKQSKQLKRERKLIRQQQRQQLQGQHLQWRRY